MFASNSYIEEQNIKNEITNYNNETEKHEGHFVSMNENIFIVVEDNKKKIPETNINDLLNNFNYNNSYKRFRTNSFDDLTINYDDSSIKELSFICEYYNININKLKKKEIISLIYQFETFPPNEFIVKQRKRLWFYISILKHDKFMKKFILW